MPESRSSRKVARFVKRSARLALHVPITRTTQVPQTGQKNKGKRKNLWSKWHLIQILFVIRSIPKTHNSSLRCSVFKVFLFFVCFDFWTKDEKYVFFPSSFSTMLNVTFHLTILRLLNLDDVRLPSFKASTCLLKSVSFFKHLSFLCNVHSWLSTYLDVEQRSLNEVYQNQSIVLNALRAVTFQIESLISHYLS